MSTVAGHSRRHMWQLTHKSVTALNSSLVKVEGGSWPDKMPRSKLALARGELSSAGALRKIGHIRTSESCERQAPQPLQSRALAVISSSVQPSCQVAGAAGFAGTGSVATVSPWPLGRGGAVSR